ncbi:unnamed protein product [Caenorhabditis sp. 36 PRJEB53466]|nr:unnamed protein product [Caenorhabditis sp. 36 PRJEB53466]
MITYNGLLYVPKNVKIVRKTEERSKKRIILRAVAVNFIVLVYYYGFTLSARSGQNYVDFIPPYINIRSDMFIAPKYEMLSCGIRKSMSQLLINIMCLLHNETEFLKQNRSLNDTWMSERVCSHTDARFHIPRENAQNFKNLTKFAFIRDPFDRFISFYLHICQNERGCWDCGDDMRCVLRNVYGSLRRYEANPDEKTSTLVDRHAAPISWNCNFQESLSNYHLIKIGADEKRRKDAIMELSQILSEHGVPANLISRISNESMTGETFHGTHKSAGRVAAEKQVREDTVVREYLHKIYFFDYLIFQFDRAHLDSNYRDLLYFWESF